MVMVVLVDTVGVPSRTLLRFQDVHLIGVFVVKYERKCSVASSAMLSQLVVDYNITCFFIIDSLLSDLEVCILNVFCVCQFHCTTLYSHDIMTCSIMLVN